MAVNVKYTGKFSLVNTLEFDFPRDEWVAVPDSVATRIRGDEAKGIYPMRDFIIQGEENAEQPVDDSIEDDVQASLFETEPLDTLDGTDDVLDDE